MATDDTGQSSKRGRGRPSHELPTDPREKKRFIDKQARFENKDVLVQLTAAAPILKQMLEAFNRVNIGEGAIARIEKLVQVAELVGHDNLGQFQLNEGQNSICLIKDAIDKTGVVPGIQEIKVLLMEIKNGLGTGALAIPPQALCRQCNQNILLPEQRDISMDIFETFFNEDGSQFPFHRDPEIPAPAPICQARCDVNVEYFNDEKLTTFLQKWDGNSKREGDFSKFEALQGELDHRGVPLALISIETKIKEAYGDITENTTLSQCAALPTLIMFYATVKEMDELKQVRDVYMEKLTYWRDAIIDAHQIQVEVGFAKDHLNKIVHAYFGSKPIHPALDPHKELDVELERLVKMLQLYQMCRSQATIFKDNPLNTGLFHNLYSFS